MRVPNRLIAVIVLLSNAASALACPVCAARTRDDSAISQWGVVLATAMMLALPAAMVGGFALWVRKRSSSIPAERRDG